MILILSSLILINLFLSIDNIIPVLLLVNSLPRKNLKNLALFFGLFLAAAIRLTLIFFASMIFRLGIIIYILAGLSLLYIGIRGLVKKEEDNIEKKKDENIDFYSVIVSIALIDTSLSLDNIAAMIGITQVFSYLLIGTIISVVIMFLLSFSINMIVQSVKGLNIAAYISIVFLGVKFLIFPLGINISNTLTSITILGICLITVLYFYFNKKGTYGSNRK